VRLAAHTDFEYHPASGEVLGEHAFTLFFVALSQEVDELVLLGRLDPEGRRARYPLGPRIRFVGLPYYRSLWRLRESLGAMLSAVRRFWRVLDDVDVVWLLGPHPVQFGFAVLAAVRGRTVALGVRQEFPRYIASRHPRRLDLRLAAVVLEALWRALARATSVVVVGPTLAGHYRRSRRLLEITASLISEADIVAPADASTRDDGELRLLSVGRLEAEKNPLLLADILALLRRRDPRWRLIVVGEGPMAGELERRLAELGIAEAAELRGYVPFGPDLIGLYRSSDAFLHVSWSEGLPQVLIESFAAALPVVATDVGGVREAVGDSAVLVPPGDASAAAAALLELIADEPRRAALVERAHRYVHGRTLEAESAKVGRFLADA
jgi:glycosyltransferase involved in cell wall biosynthesis